MTDKSEEYPVSFTSYARTGIDDHPHAGHILSTPDSWDTVEHDAAPAIAPWICLGISDFQDSVTS